MSSRAARQHPVDAGRTVRPPALSRILAQVQTSRDASDAKPLPRGDQLAIERTLLANERTFLAYFRTAAAFLTSGLAVMHIEFFAAIRQVSFVLIGLAPIIFVAGLWRLFLVRARILEHYRTPR